MTRDYRVEAIHKLKLIAYERLRTESEISMLEKDRKWWKSFHKGLAEQSRYIKSSLPPEVDQPTYEVVGEIGRIDQRDTIQSRMMIKDPNSPEYKDYYGRHPEFKEINDKSGIMIPSGHLTRKIKSKNSIGETGFANLAPNITMYNPA